MFCFIFTTTTQGTWKIFSVQLFEIVMKVLRVILLASVCMASTYNIYS